MSVIQTAIVFISSSIYALVAAAIVLIVLRSLFNYLDVNPFNWWARLIRRLTDPVIAPVRLGLIGFRIDPIVAPFVAVILIALTGYLVIQVAQDILNTVGGIIYSATGSKPGAPVAIIGYLLYGLLGLYTLAIFIRIIFSYVTISHGNRFRRILIRMTEPLLGPLRRMIPPVAMFDISPMVALIIVWVCQSVVVGTLLRGWKLEGF